MIFVIRLACFLGLSAMVATSIPTEPESEACAATCTLSNIESLEGAAKPASERDVLCSPAGLANTLQCALCIDEVWSETSWEDSAVAEYERIVRACEGLGQKVFERVDR